MFVEFVRTYNNGDRVFYALCQVQKVRLTRNSSIGRDRSQQSAVPQRHSIQVRMESSLPFPYSLNCPAQPEAMHVHKQKKLEVGQAPSPVLMVPKSRAFVLDTKHSLPTMGFGIMPAVKDSPDASNLEPPRSR